MIGHGLTFRVANPTALNASGNSVSNTPPNAPHAANTGSDSSWKRRWRPAIPSTIEKKIPPKKPGIASAGSGASKTSKNRSREDRQQQARDADRQTGDRPLGRPDETHAHRTADAGQPLLHVPSFANGPSDVHFVAQSTSDDVQAATRKGALGSFLGAPSRRIAVRHVRFRRACSSGAHRNDHEPTDETHRPLRHAGRVGPRHRHRHNVRPASSAPRGLSRRSATSSMRRPGPLSAWAPADLYRPPTFRSTPFVMFTSGSAWMANNGRQGGTVLAGIEQGRLRHRGGGGPHQRTGHVPGPVARHQGRHPMAARERRQVQSEPRPHRHRGRDSGGWLAAMAALTGDVAELEGNLGTTGVSSAVQAAIAFYPPTDFLQMDAWALKPCDPAVGMSPTSAFCHDGRVPESRPVGCAIQTCSEKTQRANPIRYISAADARIMIIHGGTDPLVPHAQGNCSTRPSTRRAATPCSSAFRSPGMVSGVR